MTERGERTFAGDAPGRVNLIGEHTDYNGGFVLPTPIPQRTRVEVRPRPDREVRARTELEGGAEASYTLGRERRTGGWIDYVQAVTRVLGDVPLGGFDLRIQSAVPPGAGLSSSAALLVALLRALREATRLDRSDLDLALLAWRAENEFVGARVGVMDPMACALAPAGTALWIDTRSLEHRPVPLPPALELAVIDSGVRHRHADGGYNTRRAECERAAALLGVPRLRDLEPEGLARATALPSPLDRRVRHVLTEDARVREAVTALESGDLPGLGRLLYASHASLRDDFAVSVPAVDRLVEASREEADVHGARITGGGFGGAVVVAARMGRARAAAERIVARCQGGGGPTAAVLVPSTASS